MVGLYLGSFGRDHAHQYVVTILSEEPNNVMMAIPTIMTDAHQHVQTKLAMSVVFVMAGLRLGSTSRVLHFVVIQF